MGINLIAPINSLGYGVVGYNILAELIESKIPTSLWPIGPVDISYEDGIDYVQIGVDNSQKYDPYAVCLRIWHQHDLAQFVGRERKIGWPIFELDTFTMQERHHLNNVDHLVVCSEWAMRVLHKNGIEVPITICPLGVDRKIFDPYVNNVDDNWTTFLNIGKWEKRKGHDILVEAFNRAFKPSDMVRLWMMCDNPFLSTKDTSEWHGRYKRERMGHRVHFLPRVQMASEVAKIMGEADCGVFPARAEGWNLELLEMMSLGKTVITTNYSAHTEFCTEDNSLLIDVPEMEEANDGIWFHGQGNWAKFGENEVETLAKHLRWVYNTKEKGSLGVNQGGIATASQFSWRNSIEPLIKEFQL